LQESKDHFRHAAFHDTLTNLPNRALLAENLKFVIERAKNHEDYQFAVLFLDLDRFKNVNDSLGHSIGDQLLIAMARRLESCIREADMVARLGGDEFAVLLDGIPNATEATNMARRIQEKLSSPFNLSGTKFLLRPASASRSAQPATIIPKTCCATPTRQCIAPKRRARLATKFSTRECTPTPCTAEDGERPAPGARSRRVPCLLSADRFA
jgi:diguanylate cyclase (GGDEF)-like protein